MATYHVPTGHINTNDIRVYFNGSTLVSTGGGTQQLNTQTSTYGYHIIGGNDDNVLTTKRFNGFLVNWFAFSRDLTTAETTEIYSGPEPINYDIPSLSGNSTVGSELTCNPGTWGLDIPFSGRANGSITYQYQWYSNGEALAGETGSTYTIQESDVGSGISVLVSAYNDGGNDSSADTFSLSITGESAIVTSTPYASGGIVTTGDGYYIHTFTAGSHTFDAFQSLEIEYLVVGGGGGGGRGNNNNGTGGGFGGGYQGRDGGDGASGGGGAGSSGGSPSVGGTAKGINGYNGGDGSNTAGRAGGGGGGSASIGQNGIPSHTQRAVGGSGTLNDISGIPIYYCRGGDGGHPGDVYQTIPASGGVNPGDGGYGGNDGVGGGSIYGSGGNGADGIVIIRYLSNQEPESYIYQLNTRVYQS